jgi:hypothetical protein
MSQNDEYSPDQQLGTESFEQGDEALDEASRLDPDFIEELEQDPSIDPTLRIDDRELEEAGVQLDDPEDMVVLDGGIDDPDGRDDPPGPTGTRSEEDDGWDLDAPIVANTEPDEELGG